MASKIGTEVVVVELKGTPEGMNIMFSKTRVTPTWASVSVITVVFFFTETSVPHTWACFLGDHVVSFFTRGGLVENFSAFFRFLFSDDGRENRSLFRRRGFDIVRRPWSIQDVIFKAQNR